MRQIIVALTAVLGLVGNALAQDKRPMTIVDFLNVPGVSNPQLSNDGEFVVYTVSISDWDANRQITHLWRAATDGSAPLQLTYGENGESEPRISPDGKWISFTTKRHDDEHNQIYLMSTRGGEAFRLTEHPKAVSRTTWSPDASTLYFAASDTLTTEEEKRKKDKDDVFAYDEDFTQRHLWKVDLLSRDVERLTQGDFCVLSYSLNHQGSKITYQRGVNPLYDFYPKGEIWTFDLKSGEHHQLTTNGIAESGAHLSPDGSGASFVCPANSDLDFYYNDNLFIVSSDGSNSIKCLTGDEDFEVSRSQWSGDGSKIYFIANTGVESQLFGYHLANGRIEQITSGRHSISSWHYNPHRDEHIVGINKPGSPGDLYHLSNAGLNQLTHHYDYLSAEFELPKQESITWQGADGVEVEGILHYPLDYVEGRRYPLVVQTHGGPASSDQYGFSRSTGAYHPVLAARGYAVLEPNYRGSTGYGDAFMRDMVGSYFNQSHLDVMTGVDHLIENGIADPDKLVKMGWSAGGHMTNKIITHTDRFKAASSGAGAINWISMYGQSDVRTYRTPWFGGTPWDKDAPIDTYWEHSPLSDIHRVKTPTLILVGQNDPRVPAPQSVELYRALRYLGVPTHLYMAPREPHGWRELRHRLYKVNVELDWFAKHALGEDYIWEKAPDKGQKTTVSKS